MVFSNNESRKRRQKIVADIASSSLITLKIEGQVERTALWDTVLWVLYVPLHMTHNGKCSSPYCKNSLNSTLVHDFWPYPQSSPHTLGSFGTVCLALAHHFCTLLAQSVYFSSKLCCSDVSLYQLVQSVCVSLSVYLEYKSSDRSDWTIPPSHVLDPLLDAALVESLPLCGTFSVLRPHLNSPISSLQIGIFCLF